MRVVTYPAFVSYSLWALASDADTDDVRRRVEQSLAQVHELFVFHFFDQRVDGHGGDKLLVGNGRAVFQCDLFVLCVNPFN